ncbi:predicted protein [Naegleria gruberi]|uniref:Predicted protein n=1 Tax=Naegleria gruberi TaxID=5762 RepID=D2VHG5_NAEGR|nr:uncharacterized protein NAEGRDRAFT_68319 [Naegleria gruberi]EFC43675.1 predicted protein [Naegleria gruberi]|eukprot:XP_002676419.1 predicted protein [Naegleria gruberi strain NEG-M]
MIKHHHSDSSQISNFLHPVNGYRGVQEKQGIIPKNHMHQNLKALKEKEHENKLKKEKDAIKKEEFKLQKYKEVESKVKDIKAQDYTPENPVNENYLKSGANRERITEQNIKKKEIAFEVKKEKEMLANEKKPPIPKKEEFNEPVTHRDSKNYIVQNATKDLKSIAKKGEAKVASKAVKEDFEKPEDFGRVPQYIKDRKAIKHEKEQKEKEEQKKKDECPPGMRLVSEEDRLETLTELEKSKREVQGAINKLPMLCDTQFLQQKKNNMERKLQEIDEAIKIFSRKKVYIADD